MRSKKETFSIFGKERYFWSGEIEVEIIKTMGKKLKISITIDRGVPTPSAELDMLEGESASYVIKKKSGVITAIKNFLADGCNNEITIHDVEEIIAKEIADWDSLMVPVVQTEPVSLSEDKEDDQISDCCDVIAKKKGGRQRQIAEMTGCKKYQCPHCEEEINRPKLKGLSKITGNIDCPHCHEEVKLQHVGVL